MWQDKKKENWIYIFQPVWDNVLGVLCVHAGRYMYVIISIAHRAVTAIWRAFLPHWPKMVWAGEGEGTFMTHYTVENGTKLHRFSMVLGNHPWGGWSPQDAQQSSKRQPGEEPHLWQSFVKPLEKGLGVVQKIKCFWNYKLTKLSFVNSWDWKQPYPTAVQHWRKLNKQEFSTKLTVIWWSLALEEVLPLRRLVTERNGQNIIH